MFQGVRCNLKEAIQLAGLTWEGRAHCGLDDARNTARLLVHLMDMGFKFSITDSLTSQAVEFPVKNEPFRDLLLDQNHYTSKSKELVGAPVQFHPFVDPNGMERQTCCYCGVLSSKCVVRKPGPTQGRCFFGCGNWTAARYAVCSYFAWASPWCWASLQKVDAYKNHPCPRSCMIEFSNSRKQLGNEVFSTLAYIYIARTVSWWQVFR